MHTWFSCKVRYEKMFDDGRQKTVNEQYLIDAMTFTEAEARIITELSSMIRGEFSVTNISKSSLSELHYTDYGDIWFNCKVAFIGYDEKTGKEKRTVSQMLVLAQNIKQAYEVLEQALKGMVSDYQITSINDSKIMDVFPYKVDNNELPDNLKPVEEFEER